MLELEKTNNDIVSAFKRISIATEILLELLAISEPIKIQKGSVIDPALSYISANLNKKITIEKLESLCLISRSSFFEVFKPITGETPAEYITRKRLLQAIFLINAKIDPL